MSRLATINDVYNMMSETKEYPTIQSPEQRGKGPGNGWKLIKEKKRGHLEVKYNAIIESENVHVQHFIIKKQKINCVFPLKISTS